MHKVKIVIEKHSDGFVAYSLGVKGVVVGKGDTYEEALADVKSAIQFHVDSFGPDLLRAAFHRSVVGAFRGRAKPRYL